MTGDVDHPVTHTFMLRDVNPPPGGTVHYQVRFLDAKGGLLAESLPCAIEAPPLVKASLSTNNHGYLVLDATIPPTIRSFAGVYEPLGRVTVGGLTELVRLPPGEHRVSLPVKVGHQPDVRVHVDGRIWKESWDSGSGLSGSWVDASVVVPLNMPDGRSARNALAPLASIIFTEPRFGFASPEAAFAVSTGTKNVRWQQVIISDPRGRERRIDDRSLIFANYSVRAGNPVSNEITVVWSRDAELQTSIVHVVTPPAFLSMTAESGDGRVVLRWELPLHDTNDWIAGPTIVVSRAVEEEVDLDRASSQFLSTGTVIGRVPAGSGVFTDTNVINGSTFYYALSIEGTIKASAWFEDHGSVACGIPVSVYPSGRGSSPQGGAPFGNQKIQFPLAAVPGPPEPLRVGVVRSPATSVKLRPLMRAVMSELQAQSWAVLVERDSGAELAGERLMTDFAPAVDADPRPDTPDLADVRLILAERMVALDLHVDVWMEDLLNSERLRVVSVPAATADPDQLSAIVRSSLFSRFPRLAAMERAAAPGTDRAHMIVLAPFVPLSDAASSHISPEALSDMMTVVLSENRSLRVVDRAMVDALFKEAGFSAGRSGTSMLEVGRMVRADAVLSGYVDVDEDAMRFSGRLIDADTGQVLQWITVIDDARDPMALCRQVAAALERVVSRAGSNPGSARLREREAIGLTSDPMDLGQAQTAAFLDSGTPDHFLLVGQLLAKEGRLEDALSALYQGLARSRENGNTWAFDRAIATTYAAMGRTNDVMATWSAAINHLVDRPAQSRAREELATALIEAGRIQEAMDVLAVADPSYKKGLLLEGAGQASAAIECLVACMEQDARGRDPLGPAYAALVRYMVLPEWAQYREHIGSAMVVALAEKRPHQALKAFRAIQEASLPSPVLAAAIMAAGRIGSVDAAMSVLERMEGEAEAGETTLDRLKAMETVGLLLYRKGRRVESEALFQRLASMEAASPETRFLVVQARQFLRSMSRSNPAAKAGTPASVVVDVAPQSLSPAPSWTVSPDNLLRFVDPSGHPAWTNAIELIIRRDIARAWVTRRVLYRGAASVRSAIAQSVVETGGLVVVPNLENGVVFAFDRNSGELRWRCDFWGPVGIPLHDGGRLYVASVFGDVTVIDVSSGLVQSWLPPEGAPPDRNVEMEPVELLVETLDPLVLRVEQMGRIPGYIPFGPDRMTRHVAVPVAPPVTIVDAREQLLAEIDALASGDQGADGVARLLDIMRTGGVMQDDFIRIAALDALVAVCGESLAARLFSFAEYGSSDFIRRVLGHLVQMRWSKDIESMAKLLHNHLGDCGLSVVAARAVLDLAPAETAVAALRRELPYMQDDCRTGVLTVLAAAGDRAALAEIKEGGAWRKASPDNEEFISLCLAGDLDALQLVDRRILVDEHDRSFSQDETMNAWTPFCAVKLVRDRIPLPRFVPILAELVRQDRTGWPCHETITALENIGDPEGIPVLLTILEEKSPFPNERRAAGKALESLSGMSFGSDIARWNAWWYSSAPRK